MLITGAGGQLGVALLEAFPSAVPVTIDEWDITRPAPPGFAVPDLVLHTAGWTDVDGAEDDPRVRELWSTQTPILSSRDSVASS